MFNLNDRLFQNKVPNRNKKGKRLGKKGRNSAKNKVPSQEITLETLMSPAVMLNAYYPCHNAADFLSIRPVDRIKRTSGWPKYKSTDLPICRYS